MAKQKKDQKKAEQYLVDFVIKQRQINDSIKPKIQEDDIDEILANPEKYALDFIEASFAKYLPKYIEAYNLGDDFAKKLIKL